MKLFIESLNSQCERSTIISCSDFTTVERINIK